MSYKRTLLFLGFSFLLALASISSYGAFYRKPCDLRTFTAKVTEVGEYDELTKLYTGKAVYTYPPSDKGQELPFSMPHKFKKGDYINQCLNLYVYTTNIRPEDR
jgi:hypothetical protein